MINVMRYGRFFLVMICCFHSAVMMPSSPKGFSFLHPTFYAPHTSVTHLPNRVTINSSIFLSAFNHIDLSKIGSYLSDGVTNNPKTSIAVGTMGLLLIASYYCVSKGLITKENFIKIKDFFALYAEKLATSCYDCLPDELQGIIKLCKRPVVGLKNMVVNYAIYHKKYAGLTVVCAGCGRVAGWPMTGYTLAGIAFVYGAFASRFDHLEAKMDAQHKETIKKITDQIKTLGDSVDSQVESIDNQVKRVELATKEIKKEISDLRKQLQISDDESNNRVNELEVSLKQNLEQRLQILSQELLKAMNDMKKSDQERADILQNNINTLTVLVKNHQLKNGQDFKDLRSFFEKKMNVLELNLIENFKELQQEQNKYLRQEFQLLKDNAYLMINAFKDEVKIEIKKGFQSFQGFQQNQNQQIKDTDKQDNKKNNNRLQIVHSSQKEPTENQMLAQICQDNANEIKRQISYNPGSYLNIH